MFGDVSLVVGITGSFIGLIVSIKNGGAPSNTIATLYVNTFNGSTYDGETASSLVVTVPPGGFYDSDTDVINVNPCDLISIFVKPTLGSIDGVAATLKFKMA